MSIRKSYHRSMWLACVLIMTLCAMSTSLFANNLDIAADRIIIKGVGSTSANGKFSFKNEGISVTDSILIEDIVITYSDPKKATLKISDENGTIFQAEVTKSLTSGEMKSFEPLILHPQHNYIITHGKKSWNVIFADVTVASTINTDSIIQSKAEILGIPAWRIEEGFDIADPSNEDKIDDYLKNVQKHIEDNNHSNIPWWIYFIIAILGFSCAYLLLPTLKKILGHKNNKKAASKQSEYATGNNSTLPTNDGTDSEGLTQDADDMGNKETELITLKNKISSLLPDDSYKCLSDDQKIVKIKSLLESGQEAKNGLRMIRHALNIEDENVVPLLLCDKIEELKKRSSTVSQETYMNGRAEICNTLIEKLLSKKNKGLSDVVADAMEEKGNNQYEILLKVIDLLPFKIKDDKSTPIITEQTITISDTQLRHSSNSYILKKWLKEQFNVAGISEFDMNKTVLDNLANISAAFKEYKEEGPRKSDEVIIDGVISGGALTDGQKSVLIRRLIKIINGKVNDPSRTIADSLSLNEFAQSVADMLQQPSTHEEAQIQTQQRNIAIVNEALDTNMTSLSIEAIKDTVKKIVLDVLQSKLSSFDIETYDDALTSLAKCNNQYNDLIKLLQEFEADSLTALPKAIREKQNRELLKSVSDKVAKLFPEQNIDSVQKLVNNLFREIQEAKESCDLIADNLEERISLRDKSYSSPEGNRDVLELMSRYDNLVNSEDANLREQIASKDSEISQLHGTISNQNEKISSLENDNQNLMSESKKMVETLHDGAEIILESCKTILNPCSDDEEAQCVDIEDRLFSDLNSSVSKLKTFSVSNETVPVETRKKIQDLLINELSSDNSPINTVCRYYAYSGLPFMTDTAREYGITFNRRNMAELYSAIDNLYVQFGINFNIPSLFVMGIEEGEFENVTGKMYGDLDNLCQNSRNHFDNIDSATKPSNVIVDVVNVGYAVDGKVGRITSVLTY